MGKVAIYFESAAVIVVLVLLVRCLNSVPQPHGQRIKALLNLAPPTARQVARGDHEVALDKVK